MSFFKDLVKSIFGSDKSLESTSRHNYSPRTNYQREDCQSYIPTWIRNAHKNNSILSVKITDKNSGGYMVEFRDSTEGFMPRSHSGFEPLNINDAVEVIVLDINDKPIVSSKVAKVRKQEDIYQAKADLLAQAQNLLKLDDPESAITSWQELRTKWDEIGHTKRENTLWPAFKDVRSQLFSKIKILKQETKDIEIEQKNIIISQIEPGHVFQGTVTKILAKGILVKLEGQDIEIIGFVPKGEISHNYISNINDVVKVGSDVRIVVLEVDRSNQRLTLGMKQLEPIAVNNANSSVPSSSFNCENVLEEENYAEPTITLNIKKIKYPGLIITEGFDEYSCGIILPNNITLNNTPICASARWDFLDGLCQPGAWIETIFIGKSEDGRVAFLQYDIKLPLESSASFIGLGEIADVAVTDIYDSYIQVTTKDQRLAYIVLSDFCGNLPKIGTTLRARLINAGDNILQYARYSILGIDKAYDQAKITIAEDNRLSEIFKEEELEELRQEGTEVIEELISLIDKYPELQMPRNHDELKIEIRAKATQRSELHRGRFYESHPDYFIGKSLKVYVDDDNDQLYLWDECETLVVIGVSDGNLCLEKIYYDSKDAKAYKIIQSRRVTNLLINGRLLKLIPYLSNESSSPSKDIFARTRAIQWINKLKYDLKKQVKKEIRDKVDLYAQAARFLRWQINQECEKVGDTLYIGSDAIGKRVTGSRGALALQITIPHVQADRLVNDENSNDVSNEEDLRVAVMKQENSDNSVSATLVNVYDDIWCLEFSKDVNSLNWMMEGFYIKYKPSVRHLKEQVKAVENYVKNDNLDMLTDIVYDQLDDIDTSPYNDIEFFNPIFNAVQEDNRQAEAVKKALAAEKIMLIQGPPGTGKTTVIVEIIRQLVKHQNKRVLVCCQAHPAVDNIYDKLEAIGKENPMEALQLIRVRNEGETQTNDLEKNAGQFRDFLHQQLILLKGYEIGRNATDMANLIDTSTYLSETKLMDAHKHLIQEFTELSDIDSSVLVDAFKELGEDTGFHRFYNNADCNFRNADVVLGTCVGVGVTRGLSAGIFDVVIIDEAAKANIGESIVPMSLGKKYILVGDDQQLPPYVNSSEIMRYVESSYQTDRSDEDKRAYKRVIEFQKTSLFEDIHYKIPESCVVTLNYQHRMNPQIGNCISELFYSRIIKNGPHTHEKVIESNLFPENVVFFDTTEFYLSESQADEPYGDWIDKLYEERKLGGSLCNFKEAYIIRRHIIPHITAIIGSSKPSDFLGIISPYAAQVSLLRQILPEQFKDCVHTIDSIQGSEYDIVIFSFVRSFSKKYAENPSVDVGFVADMRRLNVSLSRARCKLIMVGNLKTLTNKNAYSHISTDVVGERHPIEVFNKMSQYRKNITIRRKIDVFVDELRNKFKCGYVLNNCKIIGEVNGNIRQFIYNYNNEEIALRGYCPNATIDQIVDMVYTGDNANNRPQFKRQLPNTEIDIFINELRCKLKPGYILHNCKIIEGGKGNIRCFIYNYNGVDLTLRGYCPNAAIARIVDMVYTGEDKKHKPQFKRQWSDDEIKTVEKWQRMQSVLRGEIISVDNGVKIQTNGIVGIAPHRFFGNDVAIGTPCLVKVFEFIPMKDILKFSIVSYYGKKY